MLDDRHLPYPVEYKRGKPKSGNEDILQLVAQEICLEEMLLCKVDTGYIFYGKIKRRIEAPITSEMKEKVEVLSKKCKRPHKLSTLSPSTQLLPSQTIHHRKN